MEHMTQLYSYSWSTAEFAICRLTIRAHVLADALGLKIDTWQEDGLGDATGFMCRSNSDLAIYAGELLGGITHLGDKGPVIYREAEEVVANGVANALDAILVALSLTIESVDWIQPISACESTQALVTAAMKYRA